MAPLSWTSINPEHFSWILNYLRAKKISTPENPQFIPKVPKDQMDNFNILFDYLDLSGKFNLRGSKVSLQENGRVAVHDSTGGHTYVLGKNVYEHGTIRFKLKQESFQNNHWLMVGFVKADVVPKGPNSYYWIGTYGWSLGNNAQLYENGVQTGFGCFWN